jgi:RimJ/RimL family protein N-acetyltransferase
MSAAGFCNMRLILGQDEAVGAFAAERLGVSITPPFTSMGIVDDADQLIGAIIYNDYNGANIEITVHAPGCLNRRIIRAMAAYPFEQLGVLRLTSRTKRSNRVMCKLFPRLGFVFEATLKHYFGPSRGDDAIVYRMTRAEADKWLGDRSEST